MVQLKAVGKGQSPRRGPPDSHQAQAGRANRRSKAPTGRHPTTMTGMIRHLLPLGLWGPMGFNRG